MDQKVKETVEGEILDAIIVALEQQKIREENLPIIADFVITNIDKVQTQDQLIGFLHSLALKWTIFNNVVLMEEGKIKRFVETKVASQAMQLLKQGKVNEASSLAKQIMKV